jgi:tetratricopeptide (TPR) repeat protein
MSHYERALQLEPDYLQADDNYGNALAQAGRLPEAITHYEQALQIKPDYVEARANLVRVRPRAAFPPH